MLKSLELFGFKSFADRTTFEFDPGVTGVVGPNGSGKSNVVDALKWILGVQSAKSLRGKAMADVIFNGSSGRKPANVAEATLVFDNRERTLDLDFDEVRIGRRLLRSGESEYLVNDSAVRLKDVVQLFMGTGAGSNAYSIIEQGRVDQILNSNAAARRKVFDEAAGIARYKTDRAEAERKLERVEQNLLRLTDIVDEVEGRLDSVRSQAAKAAKYRELQAQLKDLWWGLAADECRQIDEQIERLDSTISEDASRIEAFESRRSEIGAQRDRVEAEFSRIEESRRTAERALARQREAAASRETTIHHERERLVDLESDVVRLRRQRAVLTARVLEAEAEYGRLDRQVEQLAESAAEARSELEHTDTEIAQAADDREQRRRHAEGLREELLAAVQRRSDLENQVRTCDGDIEALESEQSAVEVDLERLTVVVEEREGAVRTARETESLAETIVADARAARADVQTRRRELVDRLDEYQRVIAESRETRSAREARRIVLEDLEKRQSGFGIGVREILDRARTIDKAPWNHIRGTAADLLQVDLENAAIVDVALDSRAQLIVVDDVVPLVDYLSDGTSISGRVGFATYDPARAVDLEGRFDLDGRPGVVARADRLARSPDELPLLAEQLLGDTWVVETLQDAFSLRSSGADGCRFVTPQGELLDVEGTLQVGTVHGDSAVVSRKSELRRLRGDLARLDQRIATEQDRAGILGDDLVGVEAELDEADDTVRRAEKELVSAQSAVADATSARDRTRNDLESATERIDALQSRARERAEVRDEVVAKQTECEESVDELRTAIEDAEREVRELDEAGRRLEREREERRLLAAKQEERFEALHNSGERLRSELVLRREQLEESGRRNETIRVKHRQSLLQQLNVRAELDELRHSEDGLAWDVARLTRKRDGLREVRDELSKREATLRDEERRHESQRHDREIALREAKHRRASLSERILDEYQLSLEEIVGSGASALRTYAEEHELEPGEEVTFDEIREELQGRVDRIRRKIKSLGSVGAESLHDLDELETRFARLNGQLQDLQHARDELRDVVRRINGECRRLFRESFETIRGHFRELFRKLFGGGEGDIVLEDPEDPLECGVEMVARPPGKELRNLSLLSGGERTMTAVALLMAIFRSRPSPFCVLDEVDAALDEANVERYNAVVREFADSTQFIVITHRKPTMTICDVLYGVTMEQSGVSKRMTVRFEDVNENGEFSTPRRAA